MIFCGHPYLHFNQFLFQISENNVTSWFDKSKCFYIHKARIGIFHLCKLLKLDNKSEVLIPSYNCGSEIDPFIKHGVKLNAYKIDLNCEIDIDDFEKRINKRTQLVYVTHYFGFPQRIDRIKQICDHYNLFLIEDCALSLFSNNNQSKIGITGDASIFSLPKTLPLPDGGVLQINNPKLLNEKWITMNPKKKAVLKSLLPILKSSLINKFHFYHQSIIKNEKDNSNVIIGNLRKEMPNSYYYDLNLNDRRISKFSNNLLKTFNYKDVILKRQNNYRYMMNILGNNSKIKLLFKEITDETCPLSFPIIVENREYINRELNKCGILTRNWWAGFHPYINWNDYPEACLLKNKILPLPIHQNLDCSQIEHICTKILELV
jgi:perosamine synthetase